MNPPIQDEAADLVAGRLPDNLRSARELAAAFISDRLANSRTAEKIKTVAAQKILEKLAAGEDISMVRLIDIFTQMSGITSVDLSLLATGGGKEKPAAGVLGSLIDGVRDQPAPVTVPRTTYQLIDALDSIAGEVIARPATEPEPVSTQ